MASKVSISNLALTILGADRITSLEDNNENARRLTAIYDQCLEDVLRAHPWNFALVRQGLARLATTPTFGYIYEYQLPGDCLRVIEVNDGTNLITDFKIEGRKLLTDNTEVNIKYIGNITDPNQYTSQFMFVFATYLASIIAYPITNKPELLKTLLDVYTAKLQTCKEIDAQESDSVNVIDQDKWTVESR
jgi:hypothetical protein